MYLLGSKRRVLLHDADTCSVYASCKPVNDTLSSCYDSWQEEQPKGLGLSQCKEDDTRLLVSKN